MKIRNGFVTNSSSSSFILSFANENSIEENIKSSDAKDYGREEELYDDVMEAKRYTKEEILDTYKEDIYYQAKWDLEHALKNNGMSYREAFEYMNTEHGRELLQEEIDSRVKELSDAIGDDKVIVMLEYGDGGYGQDGVMEHEVMPGLPFTLLRISHH